MKFIWDNNGQTFAGLNDCVQGSVYLHNGPRRWSWSIWIAGKFYMNGPDPFSKNGFKTENEAKKSCEIGMKKSILKLIKSFV